MDAQTAGAIMRHWRAGHWLADGSLDALVEINRQCLEALAGLARAEQPVLPALFAGRAGAWAALTTEGLARLARCPFLLVDAGFDDELRWRSLDPRMVRDQAVPAIEAVFTGPGAADLVRRVLCFGWYLARTNRQLARIALGMAPACAERLAQLHLHDLDWLVQYRPGWVRPRWERNPRIWMQLLRDAQELEGEQLIRASLRGLQVMAAGALGPVRAAVPGPRR